MDAYVVIDLRTGMIVGGELMSRGMANMVCDRCEQNDADGSPLPETFMVCPVILPQEAEHLYLFIL